MSDPSCAPLPLILIRGFGGLNVSDERRIAYQGFNDGTVYPQKRGENYIYEGFVLRFLKSSWSYHDATNVVGYYGDKVTEAPPGDIPPELAALDTRFFQGDKVVIDPAMAANLVRTRESMERTLWVFRYYDLNDRNFATYGRALVRLIDFLNQLSRLKNGGAAEQKVNIIAHSMGGLIVRHAIQCEYPAGEAENHINKVVTLGTPHQGISFQVFEKWLGVSAGDELEAFNPDRQADKDNPSSFRNLEERFPLSRFLTIVGTNYKSYDVSAAALANRLFSVRDEFGLTYNRSDGLVKQTFAQIPGAPRTFVHKCHGGFDSLVTSREAYEIATRFFFGNVRARLRLLQGKVLRGQDMFGKSEFFFGVSIKPRRVDFDLFHQSPEAENCYGPFHQDDLSDSPVAFDWADGNKLIWEGCLDTTSILRDDSIVKKDMVIRLDIYVGERDTFGIGFSDNVVFRKQYYIRGLLDGSKMYLHTDEHFAAKDYADDGNDEMEQTAEGWEFELSGTGFWGRFRIELDMQ